MCSCFSFPPQYRGSGRGEREEPGLLGQWGTSATVKHRLPRPGSEKTQALQPSGCSVPSWTGCFVFWFNSLSQETYTSLTQCLSWVLKNLEFTPVSLGSVFSSSFPLKTCCWDTQGKALSLHGVETPACLIKRFKACLDFWQQLNLASFGGSCSEGQHSLCPEKGTEGHAGESIPFGKAPSACPAEMGVETRRAGNEGFRERQTPSVCQRLRELYQRCPWSGSSRAAAPGFEAVKKNPKTMQKY